jgi:hypothetical protein
MEFPQETQMTKRRRTVVTKSLLLGRYRGRKLFSCWCCSPREVTTLGNIFTTHLLAVHSTAQPAGLVVEPNPH